TNPEGSGRAEENRRRTSSTSSPAIGSASSSSRRRDSASTGSAADSESASSSPSVTSVRQHRCVSASTSETAAPWKQTGASAGAPSAAITSPTTPPQFSG